MNTDEHRWIRYYGANSIGRAVMHPFPPIEKLSFLVGLKVSQIRLNPYNLDFIFDDGTTISIESTIEVVDPIGGITRHNIQEQLGDDPIAIHRLISDEIVSLDRTEMMLTLKFSRKNELRIFTNIGPYECGQIFPAKTLGRDLGFLVF